MFDGFRQWPVNTALGLGRAAKEMARALKATANKALGPEDLPAEVSKPVLY